MRKLPRTLENPLETLFIDAADAVSPALHKLGHTPNMITTYSFGSQALSLLFLERGDVWPFAVLWMLGYFWDCVDGHYARKYDMVTRAGDLYDHLTDWIATLGLVLVVIRRYDMRRVPAWFVATYVALLVVVIIHTGCQQKYIRGSGEMLDFAQGACPGVSSLKFTRFFSYTTTHVLMVLGVVYLEKMGYARAH